MQNSFSRNNLLRSAIYDYVLRSGAAGYTDEEIADYIGVSPRRVRAGRHQLVLQKRLMALHPRRPTSQGRTATVWLTTGVVKKLLDYRQSYA